jgi:hypothetical protein
MYPERRRWLFQASMISTIRRRRYGYVVALLRAPLRSTAEFADLRLIAAFIVGEEAGKLGPWLAPATLGRPQPSYETSWPQGVSGTDGNRCWDAETANRLAGRVRGRFALVYTMTALPRRRSVAGKMGNLCLGAGSGHSSSGWKARYRPRQFCNVSIELTPCAAGRTSGRKKTRG